MSGVAIDHIILHCSDITAAERDFTAQGFTVQSRDDAGPSHGTESRFIVFANSPYVLLMQFTDAAKRQAHRLGRFLDMGEGFVDYGIHVPDSPASEALVRELGLMPTTPGTHSNMLADGTPWGVRLFTIGRGAPAGHDALPFVVADLEERAARVPAFLPHANGIMTLPRLHVEAEGAGRVAGIVARIASTLAVAEGEGTFAVPLNGSEVIFHERDPQAPRSAGQGGVIRLDLGGAGAGPDITCHGALFSRQ